MNAGFALDALLYRRQPRPAADGVRWLETAAGAVRLLDTGGVLPPVLISPDGPCVIEHYAGLVAALAPHRRVVVMDLPGFGFSAPRAGYTHRLAEGAACLHAVLSALDLRGATLALSCVNGFYGLAAALADRDHRIARLVLSQTPSFAAMAAWTKRIVPRPVRVPVLGQALNFARRGSIARGWLHVALARREDRPRFVATAAQALHAGGCFCFASVVQGVSSEAAAPPALAGLERLAVPCTLVWGSADRSHRATPAGSLLALLPPATTALHEFADCGHFPDLEAPDRFAALLLGA